MKRLGIIACQVFEKDLAYLLDKESRIGGRLCQAHGGKLEVL